MSPSAHPSLTSLLISNPMPWSALSNTRLNCEEARHPETKTPPHPRASYCSRQAFLEGLLDAVVRYR